MRRSFLGLCLFAGAGLLVAAPMTTPFASAGTAPRAQTAPVTGFATTGGGSLNLRAAASAASARLGSVPNGRQLSLACQTAGQLIQGTVRRSTQWDKLSTGEYVSDGYVRRSTTPPACPAGGSRPAATPGGTSPGTASGWVVPVVARIGDGFRPPSRPTHQGVDLLAARNTPVQAAAAGTVITVTCNASTNNCDVDGGPSVAGCGWYVEIFHPGNVITRYCHLGHRPLVQVGQQVSTGQVLGYVGSSGNSTGPHLHFEVHLGTPPAVSANAVDPVPFMRTHAAPLG